MAEPITTPAQTDYRVGQAERLPRLLPWGPILAAIIWAWAIWSCAEYWLGNPNYSYGWAVPVLALGFGIRRYLMLQPAQSFTSVPLPPAALIAAGCAILVFAFEFCREQVWHPIIVLWSICGFAVVSTIALLRICGGAQLARAEIFPVCFFFAAVPWPPRFEQPVTSSLMRGVASATTEALHWCGIEAQTAGGAIALRNGLVGITEACSGIRSLQAGLMFGLAMGEWFLLPRARRVLLVAIAVVLAVGTNLARTLTLTIQAHNHGIAGVDEVHDLVGNIIITALVLAIWVAGRLLSPGANKVSSIAFDRLRSLGRNVIRMSAPGFAAATISVVLGLAAARTLSARIEAHDQTQTAPFFTARIDNEMNKAGRIPRDVWNELHPSSGEYVRRQDASLAGGAADCFHFFWKPSPWNRFVLVHRPDICMPGVGWQLSGSAETVETQFNGKPVRFYVFRFRRGDLHALELWGAWRNGEAVPLDYTMDQVQGVEPAPAALHFNGKRRSATEIVSCGVIAEGAEPSIESAVATLGNVFDYHPQ